MIKEIKEYIKNLATLPNRLERIELLLKENTERHYLLSTIDERSSNAYTNLEALNERSSNAYTILEALNERSSNAYTILEALLTHTNSIDDKVERFQGLWQMEAIAHYENIKKTAMAQRIARIRSLLKVKDIKDMKKQWVRIGKKNDGGYVMIEDFDNTHVAYSIGIADDVSWDKGLLKYAKNVDIYQYDHTITNLPEENENFHWFPIGLCGENDTTATNLNTLKKIIIENGHSLEKNMILKMDIEGAEYNVLATLSPDILNQFSQIVIELHHLTDSEWETKIFNALSKLNQTHQLIHVHANNFLPYIMVDGMVLPELLECTYVNKSNYEFEKCTRCFPTDLDGINYDRHPEIILGNWGETDLF